MDDGKEVEATSHQVIICILCYDNPVNILNPRTKERKGLITYNKTYGITVLTKHVDADHFIIVKFFEEEINNETIGIIEKQSEKKKSQMFQQVQYLFFCYKRTFQKG